MSSSLSMRSAVAAGVFAKPAARDVKARAGLKVYARMTKDRVKLNNKDSKWRSDINIYPVRLEARPARPPERAREAPREATLAPVRRRPRAAFVRARARPGEARPDGASAPDQRTTFSPAPRRRLLFPPFLSSLQLDASGTSEARRYFRSSDTRRDFLEPPFDRRLRGRLTDASVLLPPFH